MRYPLFTLILKGLFNPWKTFWQQSWNNVLEFWVACFVSSPGHLSDLLAAELHCPLTITAKVREQEVYLDRATSQKWKIKTHIKELSHTPIGKKNLKTTKGNGIVYRRDWCIHRSSPEQLSFLDQQWLCIEFYSESVYYSIQKKRLITVVTPCTIWCLFVSSFKEERREKKSLLPWLLHNFNWISVLQF